MKDKHYNLTGELDRKPQDKPPEWMNDDFFNKLKKPEKTIYAMTNSIEYATSSIRISLSILTTYKELDQFLNIIKKYIGE